MQSLDDFLRSSPWFLALDLEQQQQVAGECSMRDLASEAMVCKNGDPVEHWFGVIDGLVKMSVVEESGRLATLAGIPAGGWFGEGSLLKDEPRRYDGVCLRNTRIAYMPRRTFHRLLESSISFNQFLLRQLNERLGQFIAALEHQRLRSPEGRLARCIAQLFDPVLYPNPDQKIALSQSELGLLSGLSRQRVNQALQTLEKAGLVTVEYGSVRVRSLAGLSSFA